MKVWIVWFNSGIYEDRDATILSIFDSKAKANKECKRVCKLLDQLHLNSGGDNTMRQDYGYLLHEPWKIHQLPRIYSGGASCYVSAPYEVL
jgi:hypothetical protein